VKKGITDARSGEKWYNRDKENRQEKREMSRKIEGENRKQISMEPIWLDEMIGEENAVRAIEEMVENMNIRGHGIKYT